MTTLSLAIIITLIAIPASVFVIRKIKVKVCNRELFLMMTEIADLRRLNILEWECFGGQILAIDPIKGEIIYLNYTNVEENTIIYLHDVKGCSLVLKAITVQLELTFENPMRRPFTIPFYRKYVDAAYKKRILIKSAKRWSEILQEALYYQNKFEMGITH
jgi:hypothetical protein